MYNRNIIKEKLREAMASVLPITVIVALLCFALIPMDSGLMLSFLVGAGLLVLGMGFFTLGAEMSMSRIGNLIGASMTKSRRLGLIIVLSLALGAAVTVAEPDLQVLATYVPGIDKGALVAAVSVGVGAFLALCMLRILFSISLRLLLILFYALVFGLACFTEPGLLSIAFDSGGVTTGPMTVPFIMALGVGVASIRSDENAREDSFGLVALCSIGPILAVMVLSFIYGAGEGASAITAAGSMATTVDIGLDYLTAMPHQLLEVAQALLPIALIFFFFQIFSLKLQTRPLMRIIIGFGYTYLGLVLFMTGVNVGFSPLGYALGEQLSQGIFKYILPFIAMLMGWYIINAEPAVHILNKQVEELSAGAISQKAMGTCLSVAISLAYGIAMLRVISGISIMWFLVPGYLLALGLCFFVPRSFTAIAFDSGGVASGPLTATFMLPLAMGACEAMGGNTMTDAFGLVALVALMPLISVQAMGGIYTLRTRRRTVPAVPEFGDNEIIELWEVC